MRTTKLDRPLAAPAGGHKKANYQASYARTLEDLERELAHLDAHDVELLADFAERDLRLDGTPRANAVPGSPGVTLRFESRTTGGEHVFTGDVFNKWQDNVRAIALAMQRLRLVDDSINTRGAQYEGFKALPGTGGVITPNSKSEAAGLLLRSSGEPDGPGSRRELMGTVAAVKLAYRKAAATAHPDKGGTDDDMASLTRARDLLLEGAA